MAAAVWYSLLLINDLASLFGVVLLGAAVWGISSYLLGLISHEEFKLLPSN
jgi:hypothetical protein